SQTKFSRDLSHALALLTCHLERYWLPWLFLLRDFPLHRPYYYSIERSGRPAFPTPRSMADAESPRQHQDQDPTRPALQAIGFSRGRIGSGRNENRRPKYLDLAASQL